MMIASAVAMLALGQAPSRLAGTAVDPDGRPIAGLELVLAKGIAPDGSVPVLGRATTDDRGRYRFDRATFDRRRELQIAPLICAYRPGLGLMASVTLPGGDDPSAYRLAFEAAGTRTVTLRDGDGRPLAGVRLAPRRLLPRQPGYFVTSLPDALVDRLEVTTGLDGRAELACLAPTTQLVSLRVALPGVATQAVDLPRDQWKSEAVALVLKPGGRLAGKARRDDGWPASGVEVAIWSGAPHMPVTFDSGPVRTDETGSFRTPPGLLAGVKYRAVVRVEGFEPVLTDWAVPAGPDATAEVSEVVLKPTRSIAGRVVDRRGMPIAGAAVVAGGTAASATTDEQGRFRLDGLPRGLVVLVVRRDGFRIDGRPLRERDDAVDVTLASFDEPATRSMTTLPCPVPIEERRRLARRMLDPYLTKVLDRGKDHHKVWALRSLNSIDPAAALEALERTTFERNESKSSFQREVAIGLAADDPDEAAAVAESIADPFYRAYGLIQLSDLLPDDRRARRLELLDRALLSARAVPEPGRRLFLLADLAERLLDLGEADRAKALAAEARAGLDKLAARNDIYRIGLLIRLGRFDLASVRPLIDRIEDVEDRTIVLGNIAARLAASDPAEAERLLRQIRGESRSFAVTFRTCQNMARADLDRARRIALEHEEIGVRVEALIFAAYGLPPSERPAARDLVRRAMTEYDRGRDDGRQVWSLPGLMPIVEAIDPSLVPELFWRSLADLAEDNDPRVEQGRAVGSRIVQLLARYDRDVAAALYGATPEVDPSKVDDPGRSTLVLTLAVLDPRRAAEVVIALPEPTTLEPNPNWSRLMLSDFLARETDRQWAFLWDRVSGLTELLRRGDILH